MAAKMACFWLMTLATGSKIRHAPLHEPGAVSDLMQRRRATGGENENARLLEPGI